MSLRFETYRWRGGTEWMARRGPEGGPCLLIVPPLFEEMHFTRATVTLLTTTLAARGMATAVIDLPGTGESLRPLESTCWADWRDAVRDAAVALERPLVASIRGGALLDDAAAARARWRFAPATGASLLRQMERAQAIGDREAGRGGAMPDAPMLDLIGYRIPRTLADAMRTAIPAEVPARILPASGIAPWRRAEPTPDPALAAALVADLMEWMAGCGG